MVLLLYRLFCRDFHVAMLKFMDIILFFFLYQLCFVLKRPEF